jgi:hypothetical protein
MNSPGNTASECSRSADNQVVQAALLFVTLTLSLVLSLVIARIFLGSVFHLMTHRSLPFVFYWRRVVFATALFWMWYLTPAIAQSHAATRVMLLLLP